MLYVWISHAIILRFSMLKSLSLYCYWQCYWQHFFIFKTLPVEFLLILATDNILNTKIWALNILFSFLSSASTAFFAHKSSYFSFHFNFDVSILFSLPIDGWLILLRLSWNNEKSTPIVNTFKYFWRMEKHSP